jgi:hypothetical protein
MGRLTAHHCSEILAIAQVTSLLLSPTKETGQMSRRKLKRFELSTDYYVTVGRNAGSEVAGEDRIFTFSGPGIGQSQGISLLPHEIERLIPILQQARADMIREASVKIDSETAIDWGTLPEVN